MAVFTVAQDFSEALGRIADLAGLAEALAATSRSLGFCFFALTHHVDFRAKPSHALRLHNYPAAWTGLFDELRLGPSDPVHRASHLTATGFRWLDLGAILPLTERDAEILDLARREGIGDGFTVPAHIPGEARGSISFAVEPTAQLPEAALFQAQIVGALAYEKARRLEGHRPVETVPKLTERQLECVMWVARGKTDWEIATILGLSRETVIDHLRHARERYRAATRSLLPLRALHDGSLCFSDIFP